jgi:DEAD/DEAH box helicase domain-containing protein
VPGRLPCDPCRLSWNPANSYLSCIYWKKMPIERIVSIWNSDPDILGNITAWQTQAAVPAQWEALPADLHPSIVRALSYNHIERLYSHQATAWRQIREGNHIVVVTGTSSGKTLCYNLPVLDHLARDPLSRALYLFPTKALAQDQLQNLERLVTRLDDQPSAILPNIYDGDTPSNSRSTIRTKARLILSNPDMLHTGILPHHTLWAEFFRQLQFVVIDEVHTYRGVFGSHVANLIRRLKRITHFYGSQPQFILTSATIANPADFCERLIEAPICLIDRDGSAHGERNFLIYNPPIVNREVGLRRSSLLESVRLTSDLLTQQVQTLVFSRTRRSVELILSYLRAQINDPKEVRGYRSGYLAAERREIERGLRQGTTRAVVATNALELGIDIGGVDAIVLAGYPGTIAATLQQAGRAGRKSEPSLAVLVTSPDALDQFLAHHPEYILNRSPEHALIQPDHILIVLNHIRCAAFELPFENGESFGKLGAETVSGYLEYLESAGILHQSRGRYFWMADQYPANTISLRSSSPDSILLEVEDDGIWTTIGQVDQGSAYWMVHPEAVYLHEGQQYIVENLDLDKKIAFLKPLSLDYYTEPMQESTVEKIATLKEEQVVGGGKAYGELMITNQVTGFKKVKWLTREVLGTGMLDLPATQLNTTGFWLWLDSKSVDRLQGEGLWTNSPNDYGPSWPRQRIRTLERDQHRCQICGALEINAPHHVHHKKPFRTFPSAEAANQLENLITVCPSCHRKIEQAVQMRSGLAGLAYVLGKLAPLFLMCDERDLGVTADPQSSLADGQPAAIIYDNIPAGIGLSEQLYDLYEELVNRAFEVVSTCDCTDGCPSCVGPAGENGAGGKRETLAIFSILREPAPKV